ncbi:unnamed protein product [Cunninghamella blakesleeana]
MSTFDSLLKTWTIKQQTLFKSVIQTLSQHGITKVNFILIALRQHIVQSSFQLSIITDLNEVNEKGIPLYKRTQYIPTTIPRLDETLLKGGGLVLGEMIEIESDQSELLERISLKIIHGYLKTYPKGKIYHIDTMGTYQTKLSKLESNDSLSRITCYKAFKMETILDLLEQIAAIQFSLMHTSSSSSSNPFYNKNEPIFIIIQEIGCLLNSDWDVTQEQVNELCQIIESLLSFNISIMVSHLKVSNVVKRYTHTWGNVIDLRLSLSLPKNPSKLDDDHLFLVQLIKAKHLKTPQQCIIKL